MLTPSPAPYPQANAYVHEYTKQILDLLGDDVVGIYLFGSLTYGDFNPLSSDIDLQVFVRTPLDTATTRKVAALHTALELRYPAWKHRVESSYTPVQLLRHTLPPAEPRPYFGEGKMWDAATYGNEWIINLYVLKNYGVALYGPPIDTVIPFVQIEDVLEARVRDLFTEWAPKLEEPEWLDNSHYQSYLVMHLCRMLYTIMTSELGSKIVSAQWVGHLYPQWRVLIKTAQEWHYGIQLTQQQETLQFLRFVIETVKKTLVYERVTKSQHSP